MNRTYFIILYACVIIYFFILILSFFVLKKKCSKGKNVGIETKQQIENTKKLQQINIVYWILVAVMLILVGYVYVIPLLLDIPYVVSNDYYSVEGEIIERVKGVLVQKLQSKIKKI